MTCGECEELLGVYLDGELDPVRSAGIDAHLLACPGCTAAMERHGALKQLFVQAPYYRAPDELRRRVTPRKPFRVPQWLPVAAAIAVLGVVWWRVGPAAPPAVERELVAAHVR